MTQEVLSRDETSTNRLTGNKCHAKQQTLITWAKQLQTKTRVNRVVFGQELLRIVVIYEERRRRLYHLLVS